MVRTFDEQTLTGFGSALKTLYSASSCDLCYVQMSIFTLSAMPLHILQNRENTKNLTSVRKQFLKVVNIHLGHP